MSKEILEEKIFNKRLDYLKKNYEDLKFAYMTSLQEWIRQVYFGKDSTPTLNHYLEKRTQDLLIKYCRAYRDYLTFKVIHNEEIKELGVIGQYE